MFMSRAGLEEIQKGMKGEWVRGGYSVTQTKRV
jgi:hypothetical protein